MSKIWVNGEKRKISERALGKLVALDEETDDRGVMPCASMEHDFGEIGFVCTRGMGHKGPHVAHGGKYIVVAVWTDRKEIWMKPEELDERVRELANLRRLLNTAKEVEAGYESGYLETLQYKMFLKAQEQRRRVEERVIEAEARVRSLGVDLYAETGEKKFPGVTVKVYKTMKYDVALAKAYCIERYPEALSVIKKEFEKLAEVTKPKFVTLEEDPRVAIDSDLSKFLEDK